jgi:tetratricopeptide (TPR) repeat protein
MNSEAATALILISILGSVATSFLAQFLINAKKAKSDKVKVRASVNGKYINLFVGNNPSRGEIEVAIANAVQSTETSLRKSLLEKIPQYLRDSIVPGLEEEWITLAESERLMGKYSEALSSLGHALIINPRHHGAWFQKGLTLSQLDRLSEAIEAYQNAIKFNPGYIDALINLGIIFITLSRFDEADSAFEKILLVEPANTIVPQIKNLIRGF